MTRATLLSLLSAAYNMIGGSASALARFLRALINFATALVSLTVQRVPDLLTVPIFQQKEGTMVWVQFEDAWYELIIDPVRIAALNTTPLTGSTQTPFLPNTTIGGPGGFWFREGQAGLRQSTYHIDAVQGDDANLGIDTFAAAAAGPGAKYGPLATVTEFQRRVGRDRGEATPTGTPPTLHLILDSAINENMYLDVVFSVSGAILSIEGSRTVQASGTVTAVTTQYVDGVSQLVLTAPALAGLVGRMIVFTSGAALGSTAVVVKEGGAIGAGKFRLSAPQDPATFGVGGAIAPNDTFDILTLTSVQGTIRQRNVNVYDWTNCNFNCTGGQTHQGVSPVEYITCTIRAPGGALSFGIPQRATVNLFGTDLDTRSTGAINLQPEGKLLVSCSSFRGKGRVSPANGGNVTCAGPLLAQADDSGGLVATPLVRVAGNGFWLVTGAGGNVGSLGVEGSVDGVRIAIGGKMDSNGVAGVGSIFGGTGGASLTNGIRIDGGGVVTYAAAVPPAITVTGNKVDVGGAIMAAYTDQHINIGTAAANPGPNSGNGATYAQRIGLLSNPTTQDPSHCPGRLRGRASENRTTP